MELHIQTRELTGSKTKKLRRDGIIPAVIYSKESSNGSEPVHNVQVDSAEFLKLFKDAGQTNIIDLVDGKEKTSVLVYDLQSHPVTGDITHISFYKPNLKEKVKAHIPVVFLNEAENKLIKSNIALLSPLLNEIEVECLPTNIPDAFEIDVTVLDDAESVYTIGDLRKNVSDKVEILASDETLIVKLAARRQDRSSNDDASEESSVESPTNSEENTEE